jgi:hypothetical protein
VIRETRSEGLEEGVVSVAGGVKGRLTKLSGGVVVKAGFFDIIMTLSVRRVEIIQSHCSSTGGDADAHDDCVDGKLMLSRRNRVSAPVWA